MLSINYLGGYNLIGKVLDCDSRNRGSSPFTHPMLKKKYAALNSEKIKNLDELQLLGILKKHIKKTTKNLTKLNELPNVPANYVIFFFNTSKLNNNIFVLNKILVSLFKSFLESNLTKVAPFFFLTYYRILFYKKNTLLQKNSDELIYCELFEGYSIKFNIQKKQWFLTINNKDNCTNHSISNGSLLYNLFIPEKENRRSKELIKQKRIKKLKKSKNGWLIVLLTYSAIFTELNFNKKKNLLLVSGCNNNFLEILFFFNRINLQTWFWRIFLNLNKSFNSVVRKKKSLKRRIVKRLLKKDFAKWQRTAQFIKTTDF